MFEQLASLEHERWADWQRYLHSKLKWNKDGTITLPTELYDHWSDLINTDYKDLPEHSKESDRKEVRRYLPLVEEYFKSQGWTPPGQRPQVDHPAIASFREGLRYALAEAESFRQKVDTDYQALEDRICAKVLDNLEAAARGDTTRHQVTDLRLLTLEGEVRDLKNGTDEETDELDSDLASVQHNLVVLIAQMNEVQTRLAALDATTTAWREGLRGDLGTLVEATAVGSAQLADRHRALAARVDGLQADLAGVIDRMNQ